MVDPQVGIFTSLLTTFGKRSWTNSGLSLGLALTGSQALSAVLLQSRQQVVVNGVLGVGKAPDREGRQQTVWASTNLPNPPMSCSRPRITAGPVPKFDRCPLHQGHSDLNLSPEKNQFPCQKPMALDLEFFDGTLRRKRFSVILPLPCSVLCTKRACTSHL